MIFQDVRVHASRSPTTELKLSESLSADTKSKQILCALRTVSQNSKICSKKAERFVNECFSNIQAHMLLEFL